MHLLFPLGMLFQAISFPTWLQLLLVLTRVDSLVSWVLAVDLHYAWLGRMLSTRTEKVALLIKSYLLHVALVCAALYDISE